MFFFRKFISFCENYTIHNYSTFIRMLIIIKITSEAYDFYQSYKCFDDFAFRGNIFDDSNKKYYN